MIKTILFATDLGAFTAHSLLHVESLAEQYQAQVIVLHVVPPIGDYACALASQCVSTELCQQLTGKPDESMLLLLREQIFEALLQESPGQERLLKVIRDIVVGVGAPANIILQEADRLQVDLIVVGSHGAGALDGVLLGSVASKVLQLSRIPVYMVPMVNPNRLIPKPPQRRRSGRS